LHVVQISTVEDLVNLSFGVHASISSFERIEGVGDWFVHRVSLEFSGGVDVDLVLGRGYSHLGQRRSLESISFFVTMLLVDLLFKSFFL
jgi:hypothetical protein